ncbi:MAG: glutamate--cysteine ligase [Bdellovibrionales bacterium RIFOXYD1_FULL_53_11]|nr:MAG: glutamate--cysteine ligase [Bdellovibrionales bacterium RIFOXYD1_FULL_53_11]
MTRTSASAVKQALARGIIQNRARLLEWHTAISRATPPPFYCSIDIRDSGHKIVPVDSNLFPAGFNNICPDDMRAASRIIQAQLKALALRLGLPEIRKLLVIPESHTSNAYYIENLHYLLGVLADIPVEVMTGWLGPPPEGPAGSPVKLVSATGKIIEAHGIEIKDGLLSANGFVPDMILLNNDFSGGYPPGLDNIKQPLLPSHHLGWHARKKSRHFEHYNKLAAEFAAITGIDPWTIMVDTVQVEPVDFSSGTGIETAALAVDGMLERIRTEYSKRSIHRAPFVFIKNNRGTYGMGIMVARSSDELKHMNRRTRNKMSTSKGHCRIDSVVVQEGVPTATIVDRLAAEPVIYLVGGSLIGGFLRTNSKRGDEDNLNSQGMVFKKLCMSDLQDTDDSLLELVYGAVAQISALATGLELTQPPPTHLSAGQA